MPWKLRLFWLRSKVQPGGEPGGGERRRPGCQLLHPAVPLPLGQHWTPPGLRAHGWREKISDGGKASHPRWHVDLFWDLLTNRKRMRKLDNWLAEGSNNYAKFLLWVGRDLKMGKDLIKWGGATNSLLQWFMYCNHTSRHHVLPAARCDLVQPYSLRVPLCRCTLSAWRTGSLWKRRRRIQRESPCWPSS